MTESTHRIGCRLPITRRLAIWLQDILAARNPSDDRAGLGLQGEALACRELERRGYRIIERRARSRLGEIDVVAWDGTVLAFVEVKTRRGRRFGSPLEAVDERKRRRLLLLARSYIARKRLSGVPVRFDVVGVDFGSGGKPRLELIQGAFQEE